MKRGGGGECSEQADPPCGVLRWKELCRAEVGRGQWCDAAMVGGACRPC